MPQLDRYLLHRIGLLLWRVRSVLGLRHWAIISCLDATFFGLFALFLFWQQNPWLLLCLPTAFTRPSSRRREFEPLEEVATLLNQPMKNIRQEWLPHCLLRYGACLVYLWLLVDLFRLSGWNWIVLSPLVAGFGRALAEAADIYPDRGQSLGESRKMVWWQKAAEEVGQARMTKEPETPEQWQEAVNLAEFYLLLDSARQYGLLEGGPSLDIERCEELLQRGKQQGFQPQSAGELAALLAQAPAEGLTQ